MKILIVEDEDLAVKKIQKTLSEVDGDAEVIGVTDSIQSTVNWLEQNNAPDLILMDISIPVIDGWEATQVLKHDPQTREIPIIALTAHALASDREKAMEVGCDGYLAKPCEPRAVVAEVQRFLGKNDGSG